MAGPKDVETLGDLRDYNLLASFGDGGAARRAAGALQLRGLGADAISLRSAASVPAVDEARMRDELEGVSAAPGVIATKSMASGAVAGAAIGAVVGAILGLIVGIVVFGHGTGSHAVGEWASVIGFAVGLGTAGAVAGGFSKPRYRPEVGDVPEDFEGAPENAPEPEGAQTVLTVRVDDPDEFAWAQEVLERSNPVRLDRLSRQGDVIGTEQLGLDAPPVQPGSGRQVSEK